ncbi:hypothetical protein [Paenibacillus planticolens]|nr:hypothetical protein [Paenibacillus planticolens]
MQNKRTDQLYTCTLVNNYDLAYYGVKYWSEREEAEEQVHAFILSIEGLAAEEWQIIELEEREMKLCNVKLKNDANHALFWLPTRKSEVRKVEN